MQSHAPLKMGGVGVVHGPKPPCRGWFYLLLLLRDEPGEPQGRPLTTEKPLGERWLCRV